MEPKKENKKMKTKKIGKGILAISCTAILIATVASPINLYAKDKTTGHHNSTPGAYSKSVIMGYASGLSDKSATTVANFLSNAQEKNLSITVPGSGVWGTISSVGSTGIVLNNMNGGGTTTISWDSLNGKTLQHTNGSGVIQGNPTSQLQ